MACSVFVQIFFSKWNPLSLLCTCMVWGTIQRHWVVRIWDSFFFFFFSFSLSWCLYSLQQSQFLWLQFPGFPTQKDHNFFHQYPATSGITSLNLAPRKKPPKMTTHFGKTPFLEGVLPWRVSASVTLLSLTQRLCCPLSRFLVNFYRSVNLVRSYSYF